LPDSGYNQLDPSVKPKHPPGASVLRSGPANSARR
jgi:hypothetical protein